MDTTMNYRQIIIKDLDEFSPELIQEVYDFIEFLKHKKEKKQGIDSSSLLLQQESLSKIWDCKSEELYDL